MKTKELLEDIFYYHPNTRKGIIVLVIGLVVFQFIIFCEKRPDISNEPSFETSLITKLQADSVDFQVKNSIKKEPVKEKLRVSKYSNKNSSDRTKVKKDFPVYQLFEFDPNTIHEDSLKLLKMPGFARNNLLKYRAMGGRIDSVSALLKIYGIDSATYQNLYPYVKIRPRRTNSSNNEQDHSEKLMQKLELNSAMVEDLIKFRGIGQVYSNRILQFREKLGGFYDVNQLFEVYQLSDTVVGKMIPYVYIDSSKIRKINLNYASFDEFYAHPYLNYQAVKTIDNYKLQHGKFKSVEDLKNIRSFNSAFIQKISPYFTTSLQ